MTQPNYLDRIGCDAPKEPATKDEVAAAVRALRPAWRVDVDYPDVVSIYPEYKADPAGPAFVVGTANETWAGDFYPSRDHHESGEVFTGFDTGIDESRTDADYIAKAIVEDVEVYMTRRPVRGEFLDAMRAFRKAAYAVNAAWEKLDFEDSGMMTGSYPFAESFDDVVSRIDEWVKQARVALNDEVQE